MSRSQKNELHSTILTGLLLFSLLVVLLIRFSFSPATPTYPPLPVSVDIVVVGSGLVGELTALAAAQQAADVLYLDLQNTEQPLLPPYLPVFWLAEKSAPAAETEHVYLPETMALEIYRRGGEAGNYAQILNFCLQSAESLFWLESLTGLELINKGNLNHAFHRVPANTLSALRRQVTAMLPERVRVEKDWLPLRLKQQERRITGLVVRTAEGEEEEISARAVVLADGGFAGNEELLQDYAGLSGVRPRLEGGHHGIGLELAQAAGAQTKNLSQVLLQPVLAEDGSPVEQLAWEQALLFTQSGQLLSGDNLTKILLKAGGTVMAVAGQGSPLARQIKTATVANVDLLAALLKSHPSVVAEQVKALQPPYAAAEISLVALTAGGLTVNEFYNVMGQQGALPGLYAAGELTEGLHGRQALPELFLTEAVVSAKIAGEQVAQWANP